MDPAIYSEIARLKIALAGISAAAQWLCLFLFVVFLMALAALALSIDSRRRLGRLGGNDGGTSDRPDWS